MVNYFDCPINVSYRTVFSYFHLSKKKKTFFYENVYVFLAKKKNFMHNVQCTVCICTLQSLESKHYRICLELFLNLSIRFVTGLHYFWSTFFCKHMLVFVNIFDTNKQKIGTKKAIQLIGLRSVYRPDS